MEQKNGSHLDVCHGNRNRNIASVRKEAVEWKICHTPNKSLDFMPDFFIVQQGRFRSVGPQKIRIRLIGGELSGFDEG